MAVRFDKVEPEMELLDIHSYRMGNSSMRRLGLWCVRVISVDKEARTAMCSWNSNPARRYTERDFKRLHLQPTKAYLAQQARKENL